MLKEFEVENFKSIAGKQIFTMEAVPLTEIGEYPDHVLAIGGQRILKISSFYGPNGGGKSNLLKAISVLAASVIGYRVPLSPIDDDCDISFIFGRKRPSQFSIYFINERYEIGYSATISFSPTNPQGFPESHFPWPNSRAVFVSEECSCRLVDKKEFRCVFKRDANGLVSSEELGFVDLIKNKVGLKDSQSFLSFVMSSYSESSPSSIALNPIFSLIHEFSSIIHFRYGNGNVGLLSKKEADARKPSLPKLVTFLNGVSIPVTNVEFRPIKSGDLYLLYLERKIEVGGQIVSRWLPLTSESDGTKKIIQFYFSILSSMDNEIVLVDDLDSGLHPKLTRAIVELFASSNNNTKQLVFNSHDILNMDNKLFRRDEIWFATRNNHYATEFFPLSNIVNFKGEQVRKDAKFGKQYLEGRYGSDPFIVNGSKLFSEEPNNQNIVKTARKEGLYEGSD